MGELDDVEHAEEQREADRDQRVHHAEHQPIHDVLGQEPRIHGPASFARANDDGRDGGSAAPRFKRNYFWPGSLRLPDLYSLSSHSTNLPSWITYLVMTGTVFW